MKEILNKMSDTAKYNLEKDKYLVPTMMWFKNGKIINTPVIMRKIPDCNEEESKIRTFFGAGLFAKTIGADLIIFIQDAAFKIYDKDKYDETEAPLLYPKSMRTECILIQGIELPSGKEAIRLIPYKGGDGEPVEFLPLNMKEEETKFESHCLYLVLQGWNDIDAIARAREIFDKLSDITNNPDNQNFSDV